MFEAISKLEGLEDWSPSQVGAVLGVSLAPDDELSNEFFLMYLTPEKRPSKWKRVELRRSRKSGSRAGMVIVDLTHCLAIDYKELVARFGEVLRFAPPNPRAPVNAATGYFEFRRPGATLRLAYGRSQGEIEGFTLERN